MIGIGNGSTEQLQTFNDKFEPNFNIYTDPTRASFRAFAMKRKFGIGIRAIGRYLKTLTSGHRQGWIQGDPWQQGGVVILDQNMNAVWSHINDGPGDHANLDDVAAQIKQLFK